jgi:hypothetical protein
MTGQRNRSATDTAELIRNIIVAKFPSKFSQVYEENAKSRYATGFYHVMGFESS